jgi:hypothetical protein
VKGYWFVNRRRKGDVSIDAVITGVTRNPDGTATLSLGPRRSRSDGSLSEPGQTRMTVLNPPPGLEAAVGTEVWGGHDRLMVGERKWAEIVSYGACRLVRGKAP